jgi:RHS repeat-associated protein
MSISSVTHRFFGLTVRQRMLIVGSTAAAIAAALSAFNGVTDVLVSACFWGVFGVLVERTFEVVRGAAPDCRALIAYLPLGCASLAYFVAKTTSGRAVSGSLDSFFGAAASLLGPFGADTATGATSTNPYQYTGREAEETGLQYNRARYYEPGTGRFISQDPLSQAIIAPKPVLPSNLQTDNLQMISGLSNQYLYAGEDPINAMDRSGLDCSTEEGEEEEEVGRERRGETVGACEPHPKVEVLGCEYGGVPHPSPGSGSGIGGPGGSSGTGAGTGTGGDGGPGGSGPAGPGTGPKAEMNVAHCVEDKVGIPVDGGDLAGGG